MGPAVLAGIAGGASLLGGWLGNRAAAKEAERNRRFQAEQSATAWQRAVKDLEAAGLNPALAYSQGPASSPGGSMAAQHDIVSPAVSSAASAASMRAGLEQIRESTRKLRSEADTAEAVADRERATNTILGMTRAKDGMLRFDLERGGLRKRIEAEIDAATFGAQALQLQLPYLKASAKAVQEMPWTVILERIMRGGGSALTTGMGAAAVSGVLKGR